MREDAPQKKPVEGTEARSEDLDEETRMTRPEVDRGGTREGEGRRFAAEVTRDDEPVASERPQRRNVMEQAPPTERGEMEEE